MLARGVGGCYTPEYKVVQGSFYRLKLSINQDLRKVADKLLEKSFLTTDRYAAVNNASQPSLDRASNLLTLVLEKIELRQSWYGVFMSVLQDSGLTEICTELEAALKSEKDSVGPYVSVRRQSRHYSDSDVPRSIRATEGPVFHKIQVTGHSNLKLKHSAADFQDSSFFDGDEIPEKDSVGSSSSSGGVQARSSSTMDASALVLLRSDSTQGTQLIPVQRKSSNGMPSNATSVNSQCEDGEQDSELARLREEILLLEEKLAMSNRELDRLGIATAQRDDLIAYFEGELHSSRKREQACAELLVQKDREFACLKDDYVKKDCDCKMKSATIDALREDKARMEKTINELRERCSEIRKKAAADSKEKAHEVDKTILGMQNLEMQLELALKTNELLTKEKEFAKEREERAIKEANAAKDEACSADRRRRESDLEVQELRKRLGLAAINAK